MYRVLKRYHRDLAVLVYLLLVYPFFTSEATYGRDPPTAVLALFLAISLGGLAGNRLVLRALDAGIREQGLQRLAELPFFRFPAALVALPCSRCSCCRRFSPSTWRSACADGRGAGRSFPCGPASS